MASKIRSWTKAIVWEVTMFFIATLITYLYLKDWKTSLNLSVALLGIKITFYYFHERIWEKIKWGKT